jgi:ketosteroid isomerase-like protein
MSNVELVKQMYADLASGNAPAALALFDPAIEWRECQGMPFVEDDYPLSLTGLLLNQANYSAPMIR